MKVFKEGVALSTADIDLAQKKGMNAMAAGVYSNRFEGDFLSSPEKRKSDIYWKIDVHQLDYEAGYCAGLEAIEAIEYHQRLRKKNYREEIIYDDI